jgi:hypothetical protein
MMKRIAMAIAILTLAGCGRENTVTEPPLQPNVSPGVSLRQMILTTPIQELGFTADDDFPTVYGVLTDWSIGERTATIMALRDGTASLYTTEEFGIIGGQGHERVRQAAGRYVKNAEQFVESSKSVTEFAYPKSGQVFFYLLTYDGVRLVIANEAAIKRGSAPTRPLFAAAQDVLTELRLTTER